MLLKGFPWWWGQDDRAQLPLEQISAERKRDEGEAPQKEIEQERARGIEADLIGDFRKRERRGLKRREDPWKRQQACRAQEHCHHHEMDHAFHAFQTRVIVDLHEVFLSGNSAERNSAAINSPQWRAPTSPHHVGVQRRVRRGIKKDELLAFLVEFSGRRGVLQGLKQTTQNVFVDGGWNAVRSPKMKKRFISPMECLE
jgi:hypothetical protein